MSSSLPSLDKTEELFRREPQKVVPAMGVHPWFAWTISMEGGGEKGLHYRRVLNIPHSLSNHAGKKKTTAQEQTHEEQVKQLEEEDQFSVWLSRHLHLLPEPTPLSDLLDDLRRRFVRLPDAMMGEVGLDKKFLFRFNPSSSPTGAASSSSSSCSPRMVQTKYKVAITHQLDILRAQIELAIEMQRPISLHCVHAVPELQALLHSLIARHGPRFTGLPPPPSPTIHMQETQHHYPSGINICWHSPNLSGEVQRQLLRLLPCTMYFSFSDQHARLHRPPNNSIIQQPSYTDSLQEAQYYSPKIRAAILATPLHRLLLESDHAHPPHLIDLQLEKIFRLCLTLLQTHTPLPTPLSPQNLAAQIHQNWSRFYAPPFPSQSPTLPQ
ncbi:hypothetical protein VP01_84g13 [Puccinia sorghi]|uniref:TatD DNase family Scn1 n=1 Tax=Puccinia sorghi TaxID=27349 RepID=A0A0L6U967_9BASI|nr:hypothetical protein VP01_84g13 [Puccinia sorghi]